MPSYDPYRDEITDAIIQRENKGGALGSGLTGLSGAMPANMPAQMPAGMPQTPAGGVPGSGLAPTGLSNVQLPPQALGVHGAMPGMGSIRALRGAGQMSDVEAARATGSLQNMRGMGLMSDFESAAAADSLKRMKRPRGY